MKVDRKRKIYQREAYTTATGKFREAERMKPLKSCRLKCNEKIHENDRKLLFDKY